MTTETIPTANDDTLEVLNNREIHLLSPPQMPNSSSTLTVVAQGETIPAEDHLETAKSSGDAKANDSQTSELAPIDRGFGAWSYLAGAFLIETIVWGIPNAFGVFLQIYMTTEPFASQHASSTLLPLVGTLSSGIIYCSGPVIYPLIARYPYSRRPCLWVGLVLGWLSLFGASYVKQAWQLLALQGVLYGIAGALLYAPCISYMSEWFLNRRGMANGVIFAGTATGGLIFPLILPYLLRPFGPLKALRIISFGFIGLLLPVIPFIKPRLPESRVRESGTNNGNDVGPRKKWTNNRTFWFLIVANTLQGFAYFIPVLWIPTFATDMRLGEKNASLALALLNGSSVVGRLSLGTLSDHVSPWFLAVVTLSASTTFIFALWGAAPTSLATLLSFAVLYGGLAGGWTCLWTGFVRPIAKDDPVLATTLFGILMLSRGIGNVLSAPISASLLRPITPYPYPGSRENGFEGGGKRFFRLIIYVGTVFAGAAVVMAVGWVMSKKTLDSNAGSIDTRRDFVDTLKLEQQA